MNDRDPQLAGEVKSILWEVSPIECEILGHAVVDDLVQGQTQFQSFEGGQHMDLHSVVAVLPPIINALWLIVQKLEESRKKRALSQSSTADEEIVVRIVELNTELSSGSKERIIDVVIKKARGASSS